eukprot:scaffold5703_cov132-Cylindrotheca_fusiformis.AAC.6
MAMNGVAALNVYKKVAIIRKSTDVLSYEDSEGNVKTITDLHLAAAATTTHHTTTKKSKSDIPVPKIKNVETYKTDIPPNYKIPLSYVRYKRPTLQELKDNVQYVIDAEDEAWLLNNSKFGGSIPSPKTPTTTTTTTTESTNNDRKRSLDEVEKPPPPPTTCRLPLDMFEIMIDIMETATAFDAIIRKDQAEVLILNKLPQLYHMYPVKAGAGVVKIKDVLQDVYNYWVSKRSKLKRPLLRRFWPVTSSDDTNPHLVFRPREKEKYKLRKKRQNDMEAYRKLQQLKQDFEHVRVLMELVIHREELSRSLILLQKEWFQQKLYDCIDTSGEPRISKDLERTTLDELLQVRQLFDLQRMRTSRRAIAGGGGISSSNIGGAAATTDMMANRMGEGMFSTGTTGGSTANATPKVIAGQNHGEPAPNFLHPLSTRESYTTSWDDAVPHVTTFVNAAPEPTFRFRHRPRVGRGGRLCIDRYPLPANPNVPTFFRAGGASIKERRAPKQRLLDLLPPPLDHEELQRKVNNICLTALQEDYDAISKPLGTARGVTAPEVDEQNDGEAVVVRVEDWLNTDDQLWGEERFAIGPL